MFDSLAMMMMVMPMADGYVGISGNGDVAKTRALIS